MNKQSYMGMDARAFGGAQKPVNRLAGVRGGFPPPQARQGFNPRAYRQESLGGGFDGPQMNMILQALMKGRPNGGS